MITFDHGVALSLPVAGAADREQQPAAAADELADCVTRHLLPAHHTVLRGLLLPGRGPLLLIPLLPLWILRLQLMVTPLLTLASPQTWLR